MKKGDWILGLFLVLATLGLSFFLYAPAQENSEVVISQSGQVVERLPLSQDTLVELEGNTVEIVDKTATMVCADCPNQVCVHQGTISHGGQAIVCSPNQVTVTIVTEDGLDGVAY